MKNKIFSIILCLLLTGCFTNPKNNTSQLNILTAQSYEGHYKNDSNIRINGKKIILNENESLWILSNSTLYNLLVSVSDSNDKIIFNGIQSTTNNSTLTNKNTNVTNKLDSSFDDEEYVWEKWIVPTNGKDN